MSDCLHKPIDRVILETGWVYTEKFTTYAGDSGYAFCMDDYCGTSFDNRDALNLRFTLLFAEKGSGIAKIDDKSVPFIAPCMFCLNEKEHIIIPEEQGNFFRAIFLHPNVINSSLDFENTRALPCDASITLAQDNELLRLFFQRENDYIGKFNLGPVSAKKIVSMYKDFHELTHEQNRDNWPCRSRSYLMWLMFLLENLLSVGEYSDEEIIGDVEEKLRPILIYIYNNYDKKITVSDITEKFYISRTTLSKMFRDSVGDSFLTYLNKLRVTMASASLRDTLLPINEIMFRVGFTDTVHFFRTFKKYTGLTPSEYREQYNWM